MRHDLLGESAKSLLRAGRIDQQDVIDATGFKLLQARDDLFGRSEQGGFFAREVGVGVRADILVALRARSTRQAADRLQHVRPQRVGLFALRLRLDDLQCPRSADRAGSVRPTHLPELGLVSGDALDGKIDGRDLVEQEIEPALGSAPDRFETARAHPQRGMGPLRGARLDDDVVEMPALAVVREALARGPSLAQERHGLLEALGCLLDRNAKASELRLPVAFADAEVEPAIRQEIECRDLLSEQGRIVPRQYYDGASKADSPRAPCKVAQEIERSRKLPDAGKVVLDHEHAVVAEILGIEHVIDVFAVAQAVSGCPIARGLGSAEQSKLHGIILMA